MHESFIVTLYKNIHAIDLEKIWSMRWRQLSWCHKLLIEKTTMVCSDRGLHCESSWASQPWRKKIFKIVAWCYKPKEKSDKNQMMLRQIKLRMKSQNKKEEENIWLIMREDDSG